MTADFESIGNYGYGGMVPTQLTQEVPVVTGIADTVPRRDYILELIDRLEAPITNWNFGRLVNTCGTGGCAMGLFPLIWPDKWEVFFCPILSQPSIRCVELSPNKNVCSTVARFLGMSAGEVFEIFYRPDIHGCVAMGQVTPTDVANTLRKFLARTFVFGPNQLKWLEALESGKYKQGKNKLRSNRDEFCCLGVGCDVLGFKLVDSNGYNYPGYIYDGQRLTTDLGEGSHKLLGLRGPGGVFRKNCYINSRNINCLITLNDGLDYTFKQIATYIRENPDNVFEGSV